ncbi:MAG: hypothetical protein EDX89_13150 [Acidobacteria bacterium]|nr:MAG: hypothetical protein EDX89_13150 [Acidobacteriota bacterium]
MRSGREESFVTIASKHQTPVERVIGFNFPGSVEGGRVVPEVVNWYLHHHRGFGCPETHDRKNRIFRGGEKVAIPFAGRVEIGEPVLLPRKPVSLDQPGRPDLFAAEKFVHEWKVPPKAPADLGYLLAQARISIEGEISRDGLVKTSFKKDQVKAALEKKLDEDLKATFSVKADEKTLKTIADEVKKGSKEGFARALFAPFDASLKQSYRFGRLAVVPELGAELSTTPVVVRLAGEFQDTLVVEGLRLNGKFVFKIGFNVGLSKKGWAWVAQRVGGEAVKRFAATAGRALAGLWEYLVAEGVIAAGGIAVAALAGTAALTSLCAWLVADAKRKGELTGLATWYVSAYSAKVFGNERPSGFIVGDTKLRDELVKLGEEDALADARAVLAKLGRTGTDAEALETYRSLLIEADGGKYETAKWRLERSLTEKSRRLAGL